MSATSAGNYDAIVVGSGPNGLCAAIRLAERGASVLLLEGRSTIGGGMRTAESTLPGFLHDTCSAAHPMAVLAPYMRTLPLAEHGLTWERGSSSAAHPMDDGPAIMLSRQVDDVAAQLGSDADSYRRLVTPFLGNSERFFKDAMAPFGIPSNPFKMLRFAWHGVRSARSLAKRFDGERAKALLAGCATHSVLPMERAPSAAVGLIFLIAAHADTWPIVRGGSANLAAALTAHFRSLGGVVRTDTMVRSLAELPDAKVVLFDTSPAQLARIAKPMLPQRYVRRIGAYRYGPGVFKIDFALNGPIPWGDPAVLGASTVHVGGTFDEIAAAERAAWDGEHTDKPFVMVVQQSDLDASRAPAGKRTGYAYCHVPSGSTVDQTAAIEAQIERFAPGFRDLILARHTTSPSQFEAHNPNYIGGAVTGGAADLMQLFTRPVARWSPYTTPNRRIFICSASTPPGGGVHGMCGYYAAERAIRNLSKLTPAPFR